MVKGKDRISRKDKKDLRCIALCYTGNPKCRTSKYSKVGWVGIKKGFKVWLSDGVSMESRRDANSL